MSKEMAPLARYSLVGAAFLLGLAGAAAFSSQRLAAGAQAAASSSHGPHAQAPDAAATTAAARERRTEEEMLAAVMSALAEEDALRRAHLLHEALVPLTSADLAALFERALKMEARDRREEIVRQLLARWHVIDPQRAAAAVQPHLDRLRRKGSGNWNSLDVVVTIAWAKVRPELMLSIAMAGPDATWANWTAYACMETLAQGDPAAQLEALSHFPAGKLRDSLCERAVKLLAEKDAAAAEARLDLFANRQQRARLEAEILRTLAEKDTTAALAHFSELAPDLAPGMASAGLIGSVLREAAMHDPVATLTAVESLPEELRLQAYGAALGGWAEHDGVAALEWAAAKGINLAELKAITISGSLSGGGWSSVVMLAYAKQPEETAAWVRALPPSANRDSMLVDLIWRAKPEMALDLYAAASPEGRLMATGRVAQFLYRDQPDRALTWVNEQPVGPARARGVGMLASLQLQSTPNDVETIAESWPVGPDRDAALRSLATATLGKDKQQSVSLARRINDPTARQDAMESLAYSWLNRDEVSGRQWIAATADLTVDQKRLILRQFDDR